MFVLALHSCGSGSRGVVPGEVAVVLVLECDG